MVSEEDGIIEYMCEDEEAALDDLMIPGCGPGLYVVSFRVEGSSHLTPCGMEYEVETDIVGEPVKYDPEIHTQFFVDHQQTEEEVDMEELEDIMEGI